MYVVKNSSRALLLALIPLALVEAVLLAFAVAGGQAAQPADALSPDQILIFYVTRMASNASLLFAGHLMLRPFAISSRVGYGVMGGVMAAASYAIAMRNHLQLAEPENGTVLTIGILPTIAGMISGFLYGQFAGLEKTARWAKLSYEGLASSIKFDGPVRVRTSFAGFAIAAIVPAASTTVLMATLLPLLRLGFQEQWNATVFAALIPSQIFLVMLVVTTVPSAIFVACTHVIARALHRLRTRDYAAIGGAMAFALLVLVLPWWQAPVVTFIFLPMVICAATMGAIYRRFAGIEPLPLPETVIATDIHALVPADHPSRHQHEVILSN